MQLIFKSFQGVTLFTVTGWSDQQQEGLTEVFVEATVVLSDSQKSSHSMTLVQMFV